MTWLLSLHPTVQMVWLRLLSFLFGSPFDTLEADHQPFGYVIPRNEGPGKVPHSSSASADILSEKKVSGSLANLPVNVEGKSGDPLLYSLLPPIIIPNISYSLRWQWYPITLFNELHHLNSEESMLEILKEKGKELLVLR